MLPKHGRRAIYAVYAFSRTVDDIADSSGAPEEKLRALASWHEEIQRLFAGTPQHPITKALEEDIHRYELPQEEFHALIHGMETDASTEVRMASMEDLLLYCRRVAGAVGILCNHIFGLSQDPGPRFAVAMGNAFQLTNILRDIAEDLAQDRLYIPFPLLEMCGVTAEPLGQLAQQTGFTDACRELAVLAQAQYKEAEALMKQMSWWRTRPPAIMKAVYKGTLDKLIAHGWTDFSTIVRPGKMERLRLVMWHGLR